MQVVMWDKYGDKWILERDAKLQAFAAIRAALLVARMVDANQRKAEAMGLDMAASVLAAHARTIRQAIREAMSA